MISSWDQSSSTDKRKRVAEVFPQHLAPRPSFFFRLTHPNAEKVCESQQLPVQPHIKEVMAMILVQQTQPIQSASHTHALPISFPNQPNQFEIGTTSTAVLTKTQRRNKNRRIKKRMSREKRVKEDKVMCETSPLLDGSRFHALSATDVLTNTQRRNMNRRIRRSRNRRIKKMMLREKQEKEDKLMCETSPLLDGGRFHDLSATDFLTNTQRRNRNRNRRHKKMMLREKQEKEDNLMCETSPLLDGGRLYALSTTAVLTNTQRRNKNRRIKKMRLREKQEKEDKVMCENAPPLDGGRFHVLSATKGEEDVNKIIVSPPRSPKTFKELTPEERAGKWEQQLGNVLQRTAETSIITKEEVIRRTTGIVSQSLVAPLMEEDKTLAGNTLVVQPSSHNMQGFARQSIVSTIVEGYDTESQPRLTASREILLLDATISSPEIPNGPKLPSILKATKSEVPIRFRRTPREDGSSIPSNELRDQGHTLTSFPDVNRLSHTPQVPSSFEVENPTILPSKSVNHANSNSEGKEPMKASNYQEYAPSLVNHGQPLSWKSIEELMQDLRENLRKMDEDDFDKDNDDLLDEDLCGVNTRSSSFLGDSYADKLLEVKVDENIVLIQ